MAQEKKKILITAHSMEVGGIERSLVEFSRVLDYDKYELDVLPFTVKGEFLELLDKRCNVLPQLPKVGTLIEPVAQVIRQGHIILGAARVLAKINAKEKYKKQDASEDAKAYALLQNIWEYAMPFLPKLEKEYDVAISYMWPHCFVARNVKAKKKIAWIHTDYTRMCFDVKKDEKNWEKFDAIAGVSTACCDQFAQVFPSLKDRLFVFENILTKEFIAHQAEAFVPDNMDGEGVKLLSVGRYCYAKAFDRVVDVCAILKKRGFPFHWYIIGYGGNGHAELTSLAEEKGVSDCFILLGKQTNPYPFMKACDIYLQPSRYEGKAVTVVEAQTLGKPVLITNYATAPTQVKDGFDGVICPQEPEAIADAIMALAEDADLRKTLATNAANSDYSGVNQLPALYERF